MSAIRRIARGIAKNRLKQKGFTGICKDRGAGSLFSKVWRKAVGWDARIQETE